MNDQLPDKTVIIFLLLTLGVVFMLIFSTRPSQFEIEPSIQWSQTLNSTIITPLYKHNGLYDI